MKKSYQLLCLLLALLVISTKSFSQNNLAAGDLAIASYQSDFDPTNPVVGDNNLAEFEDRFSLIITKPGGIAAGTVIFFTTRGWNGPLNTWHDEDFTPFTFGLGRRAVVQWTVPAGGIAQGTEVFFINKYHDEVAIGSEYYDWAAYANEAGTILINNLTNVTPIVPGPNTTDGMSFAVSGGKLLVYQTGPVAGPNAGPNNSTIRFITALLANINGTTVVAGTTSYASWDATPGAMATDESSVPPGLVNGQTCFLMSPSILPAVSNGTTEPDNGKFSACALSSAGACTALQMSAIIYATIPAGPFPTTPNWTYSNAVFPLGTSSSLCTYTILPANTITLTSAAGTNNQTRCINTAITNITYSTTGATGATFSGLPAGVTGTWAANVVTISGSPTTTVGSPFGYTVTLTGGCGTVTATGTITVTPNNTAGAPSSTPTLCVNTLMTNITHATTGTTGIGAPTGLPAGVTAAWATNVITISGTPTASGTFNYSIPLTGGCGSVNATGTITVTAVNTISLTSAAGTNNQTVGVGSSITNITYATTGATGATFAGLPAGVTGILEANVVTISGSPTTAVGSPFSYTVTLTGGCGAVNATGTITVTSCGASLTSAAGTNAQLACVNSPITNITYSTTGATGATFAGLPPGVNGTWVTNVITISGTPTTTVGSPFGYTVTLTGGPCAGQTVTGTITVNALPVVSITGSNSICAACASGPGTTIYTAALNGPAESPSNASPGTGTATITINTVTNTMRVQCTFSGLTGTTTASHIHSATAVANTGTAGVATTTPTFTGFPLGVTSGTYDNTLDMTLASSYNPAYVTANGGTTASAFAAFQAGLAANQAYFNIHTSTFGGGEIRGFLSTFCSSANSSTTLSPTSGGTWISSNPAVATVTNAGVVNGVSTGSATFTFKSTATTCSATTLPVTVNPSNTVTAPSSTPTVCINTPLTNITHTTTGATGIGAPLGLPAGVTAAWSANTITISGTPSVSGVFNYTIPLAGGCGGIAATGTITVSVNNTITLTSAAGTNAQTVCINTAITNITYSTTGATGATFSGLPAGVTGNWAANVVTISGTPTTTVGSPFSYTVTVTGGCGTITANGTITVNPANTIALTSAVGTNAQTLCINTAITNITYSTTGATGATFSGLPAGVTGNWAVNVVTISGTPTTTVGSPFNYTVNLTGGCGTISASGTITVISNNTISLTSGAGSNIQTRCINTAITPITYGTTGATGATFSGLPAGVTGNWAANVATISGSPTTTVGSPFNYTVTLTGGCGSVSATGTITVTPNNTITLTSAPPTTNQSVLVNTAITNITYSTTGATGATFSGLPPGVTGNWAANVVTISGSPTTIVGSPFNYTVTLTGGCGTITAIGTITVFNCSITRTSAAGTDAQTVCNNTPITNINYATTAATGATFSGLPAGINGAWAANVVTISGTPTVYGIFSYTVTPTGGGCTGVATATGTITINPDTWLGGSSSNWFTPANWSCGVPGPTTDVTIPAGTPNPPVIAGGTAQMHNLTIQPTVILTNNAALNINGGGIVVNNGTYTGTGAWTGALFNNSGGTVAPGGSPGCMSFGSGYNNGTGTEVIEIGGTTPCTQYDQLQITGTATLSGTLNVVLFGGYIPNCGESYTIMTFTSRVGTFTTVSTPALPAGLSWNIQYNTTSVVLSITGNPAATATPSSQSKCSGSAITTIVLSSTTANTTYTWTRDNPTVTGIATNGSGNISGTLTNPTNIPVTVTFTITPTSGTCVGSNITATVLVNPTPVASITPAGPVTICQGNSVTLTASATCASFAFSGLLSGVNSVPANASTARGVFNGTYNASTNQLFLNIVFNDLTGGNANAAHIHSGGPAANGPVIIPFPGFPAATSGTYTNTFTVPPAEIANLMAGNTYINIHNATFPGGEIRGQITNLASNVYTISGPLSGAQSVPPNVTAATGNFAGTYNDLTGQLNLNLIFNNLTGGNASAAHIHTGAAGTNGAVIIPFGGFPAATSGSYNLVTVVPPAQIAGFLAGNTYINIHNAVFPGGEIRGQIAPPAAICATNTYLWSPGGATTQSINVSTANTYSVTVTDGNTCSASASVVVNVNPIPVGSASPQTICSGGTTSVTLNATTPPAGTTYSYTAAIQTTPTGGTITGQGAGTANPIAQTLTNTGTTFGVIRYTVTPSYTNGGVTCAGTAFTIDVTVNPAASGSASPQTICSGGTTSVTLSATTPPAGTTYSYTAAIQTTPAGGTITGQGSGTANPIAQTLTNTGTTFGVIRYTVTPSYTNAGVTCAGIQFTVDVTVNPRPTGSASPQTICSGSTTSVTLSANTPAAGTTYVYSAAIQTAPAGGTITGQGSGSANPIAQTLTNTGTTFAVIRYTVTPSYTNAGATCAGTAFTVDVTVNPVASGSASAQTICSGGTTSVTLSSTTPAAGTTYAYTAAIQTTPTGGTITGQGAGTANPIAQTLTNTGTTFGVIRYTVTPSYTNAGVTCAGTAFTVDVTVNPRPTGSASPQTICNGGTSSVTLSANTPAAGTTYVYSAAIQTAPAGGTITGQGSGSANPIAQTLTNTGTSPGVIRYTVTPSYTNAGATCAGTAFTVDVTVNPTATVNAVANQGVCNGSPTTAVNFTSPTTGGTIVYNWTNNNTTIGLAAGGSGNIASFTAINTGTAAVTATITVTPTYTNGISCLGTPITFTITVNPTGQVNQPASQVVCNGAPTAPVNFTTTVPGTVFNWTNNTPAIGLAASGTGNIASFTATNATNAPLVGTITVTPVYTPVSTVTQTFLFTGAMQTFTVPVGVTSINIDTYGAAGGNGATGGNASTGGTGGKGTKASGTLAVTAGQVLNIFVGGAGATPTAGFNGGGTGGNQNAGGGGGASDVRFPGATAANRILVAAGGGGGGRGGCESVVVAGGNGGNGDANGINGTNAPTVGGSAGGGFGAIGSAFGGAGLGCAGFLGTSGVAGNATGLGGNGGNGQSCCCFSAGSIPAGGGGGGGFVGGGGAGGGSAGTVGCSGNDKGAGGGGAGGSSFTGGVTSGSTTLGVQSGNGQVVITYAVAAAGIPCPGSTKTFTITVNPTPQVDQPANQVVCNNTAFLPTNFTTPTTGGTISYAWTNNNITVGLAASGTGNIPAFTGTNATNAPNVATVTVTPSITTPAPAVPVVTTFGFTGAVQTFTVPAGITSITIDSYGAAGAQGASGNSNAGPTSGGFGGRGSKATGTLVVIPGQVLNIFVGGSGSGATGGFNGGGTGANTAGGGGGASDVRFPGATAADRLIVGAGGGGGGRGGCESGTGITGGPGGNGDGNGANGTNAPTVGGSAGGGFGGIGSAFGAPGIGCPGFLGASGTAGVAVGTGGNGGAGQSCCCFSFGSLPGGGGGGGGFVGGGGAGGGSAGTAGCSGNDKGAGGGGAGGSSYTGGVSGGSVTTGVQTGNGQVVITYVGAGTLTCAGTPKTFTYTVNPTTTVDPVANQVVCNGSNTTAVNFTSPTTGGTIVYNWTNSAPSIGLAASGTGNIASFTAVNVTNAPVVATITVTPTYTNGAVSCVGTPITFTITVNPPPVVNPVASQVVCNGAPTANINFTTPSSGGTAVFNWTNNTPSIGLSASGTGDILSFNAINATNAPVVATITVTMSYTNGGVTCISLPVTFTITVNPTPTVTQPANQIVCANTPTAPVVFTGAVAGTVYNWTNNTPSIGLAASGTGNIASFTALNATNVPVIATIIVTPSYTNAGTTCTGALKTFTITVNPVPTVAAVTNKAYCRGATTLAITFNGTSGNVPGTVYNWTNSTPAIGLAASGTGDIAPFVTTNTTNGPLVATIIVTPVGPTGCVGTPITFTITVNPTPIVNPVAGQVLCNGSPTAAINFTSPTTGPTGALSFLWTNSAPSIGLAANGSGPIPSFTAVNTGLSPVTALITVTPVYTNAGITCTGTAQTFTIVVNPTPTVNPVANQVLCNGSNTAAVNFTGSIFGTIYNWTNNNTSIGLAASGAGNIASFVATNATNVPQVATITVTPNFSNGVTCPGTPITFTITVNPIPTVNPVANQTVCAGATVTQAFTGAVAGTVYNWTNSNPAIGLAASGTGNLNFVSTNTTGAPLTGTIVVTPTYTNGGGTCTGTAQTFTITVNPIPTVNAVLPQVLCNGSATTAVNFTGAVPGTVYNWTNTNTSIGLAASGTGNIASFIATNATAVVQTATITVTPTYTNGATTCTGTPITFTITVNPTPAVNTIANQTVCAGAATTAVTITGPVAGTVYNWTNNNPSIGLGASGTNTIPSFIAINTGSTPVTATITVTPTFTNGGISCSGVSSTFTITVNPKANVNQPADQILCNGSGTAPVIFTGTVAGTIFSWTNNNTAIGLAASGTGNIASFIATNATAAPITATITVTPSSPSGCTGTPVSFTITVNPTPSVNAIANQTVCAGSATAAVTISGPVAGTVYTWTNDNTTIGLGASGIGNIPSFIAINPTINPVTATITVTPGYTNGGITCTGPTRTFTITVSPLPNIVFINMPQRVCLTDTIVTLNATPAGGIWSGPGVSGNTFSAAAAGVGVPLISYTVTNGSGCTATRTASIVVNDCLERHNIFQTAIRIWPNPNGGRFSIQFNSDKYKEFKVKIVDAAGKEAGYYEFKNLVYGQIIPFDLSRLASGQYFLYVYNTQESGVFPIVIVR